MLGFPVKSSGQSHLALWPSTVQRALGAHGLAITHGLMHCRLRQACVVGQSSSVRQPGSSTGTVAIDQNRVG